LRHERATEEIRELAALYALGSLTQHEARSFEIHRQGCPVCEDAFRKFEQIVAEIGLAVEEAETPEYIRDLLLARIEREPQAFASAVPRKEEAEPQAAPAAQPMLFQSRREKPGLFAWILAAVLAGLAILAFYSWKSAKETNSQLEARVSAALADADNLRILLDIQKEKAGDLERILAVAGKHGARIARLVGQAAAPTSSGAVLWDPEQSQCLLFGFFPPEPEGKVYELWFVTPTARVPVGLIKTDPTGRTLARMPVPKNAADAAAIVVTLEPDNGSQIPTTPFCAVGRID
jgi:anti-sigma-K factor RskA